MKYIYSLFFIFFSSLAFSGGPQCDTKVTTTRVSNTGGLYLTAESIANNQSVFLCSVSSTASDIAPETCRSWLSILQTAQVAGNSISISYKYAEENIASCGAILQTNPPTPYFVQLIQ